MHFSTSTATLLLSVLLGTCMAIPTIGPSDSQSNSIISDPAPMRARDLSVVPDAESLTARSEFPLEQRQIAAALEVVLTWIIEIHEAGGEVVTEAVTGTAEISESEIVTAGEGVTIVSRSALSQALYRIVMKKVDAALGVEGLGEVIVDRFNRIVKDARNLSTTLGGGQHIHIESETQFSAVLSAPR